MITHRQHTIASAVEIEGVGLHTGSSTTIRFEPAPPMYGRRFVRADIDDRVELTAQDLDTHCAPGRTALARDGVSVETVEHVFAALAGLGIDNVRITLKGPEPPAGDGSASVFVDALTKAGIVEQDAPLMAVVVEEPVVFEQDGARVVALPMVPEEGAISRFAYALSYRDSNLARGWFEIGLTSETFRKELAPARTFCLARDVEHLKAAGLGRGATHKNTLVIDGDRVLDNELRFANEPVRHKVLDLVGDTGLVGSPVVGRIMGFRSGHRHNWRLVRYLLRNAPRVPVDDLPVRAKPVMGIADIARILPHRYPFLLVDRVISLEPEKRIVAVKNVSMNEEFFQGHFPGNPVMPGVLQVEALAQAAGLLLSKYVRVGERMAALVGLDGVKMRKPVLPGDRLLLNVEVRKIRRALGVCEGVATVAGEVVAEATLLFGLIRERPVEAGQT